MWKSEGCVNIEGHKKLGIGNIAYLKQFQRSCYRGACRTCYRKWIAREANKATRRIETYADLSKQKLLEISKDYPYLLKASRIPCLYPNPTR